MNVVIKLIIFFIITQLLGLVTAVIILGDITTNPFVRSFVVTSDSNDPANALLFLGYVLIGAATIIILIRYFKLSKIIFKIIEFVLISTATSIVFYSIFRVSGFLYIESMGAGIMLGLLLAGGKYLKADLKNLSAIIATAGVGVIFGISMGIVPIIIFLVLLSLYDALSVFVTKHMVEIAGYVVSQELAFTVTSKEKIVGKKEERRLDLGTGDMVAPVAFEVSALAYYHPYAAIIVFFGAVVSFSVFIIAVWNKKIVLPALPPIVAGMLIFFFLGLILRVY